MNFSFFFQGLFRHTTCSNVYDNQFNWDQLCYGNVLFNTQGMSRSCRWFTCFLVIIVAEDYYIAYEVAKQGWKLRVASTPAQQNSGEYSVSTWTDRMVRWCKLRMRLSPLAYFRTIARVFFSSAILSWCSYKLFI